VVLVLALGVGVALIQGVIPLDNTLRPASAPPALGQDQKDPTHTANFGVKLLERLRGVGVACELVCAGAPDVQHPRVEEFLIERLTAAQR
jgi:hypothetical protein